MRTTTTPAVPTARAVVDAAAAEVGTREGRTGGHWNNDTKYADEVPGLEWADRQPWCATFVSWVALRSGAAALYPRTASCDLGAAWFKDRGEFSDTPRGPGDQVFFGTPRDLVHTGLVVSFDADTITTIEGNTNDSGSREGDGVYRKVRRRRDAYVVGYGHPSFPVAPAPAPKPPKGTRLAQIRASLTELIGKSKPGSDRRKALRRARNELPAGRR